MKTIQLTQGQVTLVSDHRFEYLNQWKWHAQWDKDMNSYYAVRSESGKTIRMSRLIMATPKGFQVDHINHNTLDNRCENLRLVTHSQNQMNRKKHSNNTSGFTGVRHHRNKFRATIGFNNKLIHLGHYDTPQEASEAYQKAASELFGEYKYSG